MQINTPKKQFKAYFDTYLEENFTHFNHLDCIDRTKDKISYKITFARIPYKYIEPKSSDGIFRKIKLIELEETKHINELFVHE